MGRKENSGVGGVASVDEAVVPAAAGWPAVVWWWCKNEHETMVAATELARQKGFLG